MPIQLQVEDVLHIRLGAYQNGQVSLNNLYYKVSTITGGATFLEDVPNGVFNFAKDHYKVLMTTQASFVGTSARIVAPAFRKTNTYLSDVALVAGTAGDEVLPTQDCGVWSFRTDLAGRKAYGRNYLPFLWAGFVQGTGHPSEDYITAASNWIAFMSPNITVPVKTHSLVLNHGVFGKNTGFNPVTASRLSHLFGTQRRRGDFGKQNPNPWG